MQGRLKLAAWLAALYGGVLATVAALAVMVAAGTPAEDQAVFARMLNERASTLGFVALLLLATCGGIVAWLFKRYVIAPHALAEQTRVVLANPGYRVDTAGAPELSTLAAESTASPAPTTGCRATRRRRSPSRLAAGGRARPARGAHVGLSR